MDYLLNGDIYIKRRPAYLREKSESESERFIDSIIKKINAQTGYEIIVPEFIERGSIEELNYVISEIQDLSDFSKSLINNNTLKFIYNFIKYVLLGGNPNKTIGKSEKAIVDYSGCENFWQLFVINSNIVMNGVLDESYSPYYKIYDNKIDMDNDFIRLSEFLDNATFIGKEFKRTKPVKSNSEHEDKSFMNSEYFKYIVLYTYDGLFLVKEVSPYIEKYFILESKYTMDKNYEFYGDEHEEYKDKSKLYREIINQIVSCNKENNNGLTL